MTLFQLLQEGCEIKFPFGYILKGYPDQEIINTTIVLAGEYSDDGVRDLTTAGTAKALADARWYEKQYKNSEL